MSDKSKTQRFSGPVVPVPAVNAAIFNKENKVLLTLRSPRVRDPGKWCLPGGHFDGGEDWKNASLREVREETGLIVLKQELIGIYSDPALTITETLVEGVHKQFLTVLFRVRDFEGDVSPNDEVAEWGWFGLEDLPAPLVRSHPTRIQDAFAFNGTVFVR